MNYSYSLVFALPPQRVFSFFADLQRWFRLNPQWEVESFGEYSFTKGGSFAVTVRYDRSEEQVAYQACITDFVEGERLALALEGAQTRKFGITVQPQGSETKLLYEEESESELSDDDKTEINLWLRSVGNYLVVTSRRTLRSRLWKWFVDRIWLRMSPFGRRITIFILLGEAFSLALFILFLVWHYYFR
ncbi:MAG TPA: hypothetical protein VLH56_10400 [Dissulfurispiraceae bacterium]|nr:hypothetical protein [Dissulfurispiraceae bacterium]